MVNFFTEDIEFNLSSLPLNISEWITITTNQANLKVDNLNFVFCSDAYLLEINKSYLHHDYYTDIITFDNSESSALEGDIFISIERVRENAQLQQTTFKRELLRVIIHGVLHLIGYDDKDDNSKITMRMMEDKYLDLYFRDFQ
ncbi:rRNA maturation RNase YbeY [Porifericola rhodea]|uniref:rRNA maturation RNase YbeY n=1 Tax=Porifericola rhodea TaxID=930972 RepID=UPI00266572CB|nr:rRNA maturation RNase YbeY [Porifericola rhodea]WKN33125.1 rRNA maturation RNase YbeY [Porifericola rhodea]